NFSFNRSDTSVVMHEVMYREALHQRYGQIPRDSRRIRYFNSYVAGNKLANMTEQQYMNFIENDVELGTFSFNGVEMHADSSVDFYQSSHGQIVEDGQTINFQSVNIAGNVFSPDDSKVFFYPDGSLNYISELTGGTKGTVM